MDKWKENDIALFWWGRLARHKHKAQRVLVFLLLCMVGWSDEDERGKEAGYRFFFEASGYMNYVYIVRFLDLTFVGAVFVFGFLVLGIGYLY